MSSLGDFLERALPFAYSAQSVWRARKRSRVRTGARIQLISEVS